MPRTSLFLVASLFAPLLAGCMTTPLNGDAPLCGVEGTIQPSGWGVESGWRVNVAAAPSPYGPWTDVASTMSSSKAFVWTDRDNSTESYFSWNAGTVTVPPGLWRVEGSVRATYVRAYYPKQSPSGSDEDFYVFNTAATSASGKDWFNCADAKWQAGGTGAKFYTAVGQCASPAWPTQPGTGATAPGSVRITAPIDSTCPCPTLTTVGSDVTIQSPADLPQYRCVSQITGSVTIKNGPAFDRVSLPQLTTIGGDLIADLSPSSGSSAARVLSIPALNHIGNNVTISAITPAGATTNVDLGLPAMAAIGGNVALTFSGGPINLTGLGPVSTLSHDLTIDLGADTAASGLLGALAEVKGNVALTVRGNLTGAFPSLSKVDGTLSLAHTSTTTQAATIGFANVASVGKDLDLVALPWASFGTAAFGQLASIGGTLRVESSKITTLDIGQASLAVGSLAIDDDPVLASFPIRSVKVSAAGDITVVNDPVLPTCQVSNFLDAQTALGWNGTFSVSGTDDNAICN